MNSSRIILKVLLLALIFATWAFGSVGCVSAATHYVNPGESIQDAVNAADPGDTIIVCDGTYTENVDVNKRLTIQSENGSENCIIQAAYYNDYTFEVTANYVNITALTVKKSYYQAGICLKSARYCNIINCIALSNDYGILLQSSSYNIITNTTTSDNGNFGIELTGSNSNIIANNSFSNDNIGIYIGSASCRNIITNNTFLNDGLSSGYSSSYSNIIENNTINGKPLVYLENKRNSTVTDAGQVLLRNCDNITVKNLEIYNVSDGLNIRETNNCIISNSTISNCSKGIVLSSSNYNSITNTNLNCGWDIALYDSDNNNITNNILSLTGGAGVYIYKSSGNVLTYNTITSKLRGMWFYSDSFKSSSNNRIYLNNFIDNTQNIYYAYLGSVNIWNSTEPIPYQYNNVDYTNYLGNYWSDYTGDDLDGDGVGNSPYSSDNYPLIELWENYFSQNQPPTAIIDSITPNPAKQGKDIVSFTGHGNDSDGSVVTYNWTSSIDGFLNTSPSFTKPAFELSVGTHIIYFSVQDDYGTWSSPDTEILTILTNQPPVASFTYSPVNPTINETITFNASTSYDPEGSIVSYNWSFGDGNSTNTTGSTITHSYALIGEYIVNLTVTDDEGATNRTSKTIKVFPDVPYLDTELGTYPSICGIHNGTITMTHTVNVSTICVYSCTGTGGHIEYAKIWNSSWEGAEAHWHGYVDDWHNCSFDKNFTLVAGETYDYTIRTSSYPQVHHTAELLTAKGWITCEEFVDINGKRHEGWIPAIRLS